MNILIVRNTNNTKTTDASVLLAAYLNSQGIVYTILDSFDLGFEQEIEIKEKLQKPDFDLVVVLGGDGTILKTAGLVGSTGIPILGINFGRLGFLSNSSDDGVVAVLAAALAGDVVREQRSNLRIDVMCEGDDPSLIPQLFSEKDDGFEQERGSDNSSEVSQEKRSFFALNELAVTRGSMGRVVDFSLRISDAHLADMRGDGIVVATTTGSTAYALSAGGPLVTPEFDGLVVVPLAPHTLHSRAVVTAGNDVVEVDLTNNRLSRGATLFIDGDPLVFETAPIKIWVRRGDTATVLLRYKHRGFYKHAAEVFFS